MAKLRKAVAYRRIERPYTRKSKFRKLSYVRATPHNLIVKYVMGEPREAYDYKVLVRSSGSVQVRHNALEAARKSANKFLETKCGKKNFCLKIRVYPHHILRENPLASGAGADRMSTGMKKSFGKPIGLAAQVREGQDLFEILVKEPHLSFGKGAAERIKHKLPVGCKIVVEPCSS
ncbi:50S ribosomal protein L16 [Candidatus Woesearchaeota archaeon]|nr:MAG: 50S ribosomal protein L16 [Candidatus Woesearchaeota archaeon]